MDNSPKKEQYVPQRILQDYIVRLFEHYDLPLPGSTGSDFKNSSFSRDALWGSFVVEYVKKYGGGGDVPGGIYVRTVNCRYEDVTLDKTDVGLGNVDNTADLNKPVSIPVQSALDALEESIGWYVENFTTDVDTSTVIIQKHLKNISEGLTRDGFLRINAGEGISFVLNTKSDDTVEFTINNTLNTDEFLRKSHVSNQIYGTDSAGGQTTYDIEGLGNVNSDWNTTVESDPSYIKNKPNLPELLDQKVDKIEGKGLSENDLTNAIYGNLNNTFVTDPVNSPFQFSNSGGRVSLTSGRTNLLSGSTSPIITDFPEADENGPGSMSSSDFIKLSGIAEGAEVNVQSNWSETETISDAYILNKPVNVTQTVDGFMSKEDKTKLDGIAVGAEVNIQPDYTQSDINADDFIKNKPDLGLKVDKSSFSGSNGYVVTEMTAEPNPATKTLTVVKTHTSVDGAQTKTYPLDIKTGTGLELNILDGTTNPTIEIAAYDLKQDVETLKQKATNLELNKVNKSSFNESNGYVVTEMIADPNPVSKILTVTKTHTSVDGAQTKTYPLDIKVGTGLEFNILDGTTNPTVEIGAKGLTDNKVDKATFGNTNGYVVSEFTGTPYVADKKLVITKTHQSVSDATDNKEYPLIFQIGDGLDFGADVVDENPLLTISANEDLQRKSLMDDTIPANLSNGLKAGEVHYPSTVAVKTYVDAQDAIFENNYQKLIQKDTSISATPIEGHYPTTKAIKDYVDTEIIDALENVYRGDWEWCTNTGLVVGDSAPAQAVEGEFLYDLVSLTLYIVDSENKLAATEQPVLLNGYLWDIHHFVYHLNQSGTLKWSGSDNRWYANISNETGADNQTIDVTAQNKYRVKDEGITTIKLVDNAVTSPKIADNAVITSKINSQAVTQEKVDATYRTLIENVQADWTETDDEKDTFIQNKPNLGLKVDKSSFDGTSGYVVTEFTADADVDNKKLTVVKTHTSVNGESTKTYPLDIKAGTGLELNVLEDESVPTIEFAAVEIKEDVENLKQDKVDKTSFNESNGYVVTEFTAVPDPQAKRMRIEKTHTSVKGGETKVYPLTFEAQGGLDLTLSYNETDGPIVGVNSQSITHKIDLLDSSKVNKSTFNTTEGHVVSNLNVSELSGNLYPLEFTFTNVNDNTTTTKTVEFGVGNDLVLNSYTTGDNLLNLSYDAGPDLQHKSLLDETISDTPVEGHYPSTFAVKTYADINLDLKVDKESFNSSSGYIVTEFTADPDFNAQSLLIQKTHTSVNGEDEHKYPLHINTIEGLVITPDLDASEPTLNFGIPTLAGKVEKATFDKTSGFVVSEFTGVPDVDEKTLTITKTHQSVSNPDDTNEYPLVLQIGDGLDYSTTTTTEGDPQINIGAETLKSSVEDLDLKKVGKSSFNESNGYVVTELTAVPDTDNKTLTVTKTHTSVDGAQTKTYPLDIKVGTGLEFNILDGTTNPTVEIAANGLTDDKVDKSTFSDTNGYIVSELTAVPDLELKTLLITKTHQSVSDSQSIEHYPLTLKVGDGLDYKALVTEEEGPVLTISAETLDSEKVDKSSFDFSNGYVVSELTADLEDQTLTVKKYHTSVNEEEEVVYPLHLQAVDGLVLTPDGTIPTEPVIKIGVPSLTEKVEKSKFDASSGFVVGEMRLDLVDDTITVKKTHISVDTPTVNVYDLNLKAVDGLKLTGIDPLNIEIGVPSLTEKVEKSKFDASSGFVVGEMRLDLVDDTITVKKTHISVDTPTVNVYDLNLKAVDGLKLTGIDPLNIEIGVPDLANKVDKVENYGLSKNDFTDVLKTKLDEIAEGAEVNVQSDWNQTTETADDYIKGKPVNVTQTVDGFMSKEDKTKLDGIAEGAEVNVQSDWDAISGDAFIQNKPAINDGLFKIWSSSTSLTPPKPATQPIFSANSGDDCVLTLHDVAWTGEYADVLNTPPIVNDLTTGGSTSVASAETVKDLKSQLNTAMAQQHLRGAVWNALTSSSTNNYGIDGSSITINNAGTGYKVGDAVFIPASTLQGDHSIDAIIVITAVTGGGESGPVDTFTVSKVGDYEIAGDAIVTSIGGSGSGLAFDVTWVEKPASTLADIQLPVANDIAFVLEDEVHNGETWQWAMMDYNGDGIYNWVPITTVDIKARDFVTNPISVNELGSNSVSTVKIQDGSITLTKIDTTFLSSIINVLPDWDAVSGDALILNKPTIGNANLNVITTASTNAKYGTSTKVFDANATSAGTLTLHDVARTGSYNDLLDKAAINNPTITLQYNGASAGTFTLNQASNGTVNFTLATASTDGIMSKEAMTKLNGIEAGAQVNVAPGDATLTIGVVSDEGANVSTGTFTANASTDKGVYIPLAVAGGTSGLLKGADKTKLDGIAAGAEVNVQSDWNQTTTTADDYIKNKPTIGNATLTVGIVNDAGANVSTGTFTANATTNVGVYIPLAVAGSTSGLLKGADKTKLDTVLTEWYGTATEYAAIGTKDANTLYNIYE